MKKKFIGLLIVFALILTFSTGYSQSDSLVLAPEIMFNGAPPVDFFFKPGRILDENTIWICGYYGSIFGNETYVWRSIDGGNTFTHNSAPIGTDTRGAQLDAFNADTALVAMDNGEVYRTTDGGTTWNMVYSYTTPLSGPWFDGCRILNDNVAIVYGDGDNNGEMHFARTDDKGATWTEITTIDYLGAAYAYFTWGTGACTVGESVWCSATSTGYDSSFVFRSYDAGITWNSYRIPLSVIPNYPRSIAFSDDNNGMIAARGGYLVASTDGGAIWTSTNNPDSSASCYPNSVAWIPGTNIIACLDDIGVFYTSDLGATWTSINVSDAYVAPNDYIVTGTFLTQDFGYAFTDNGLVLRFKDQLSTVSGPNNGQQPQEFHLSQNYPNPFNPITNIEFTLPKAQYTELKIYNALGMEVTSIVSDELNQGNHTYQFDGSNIASGVYYYQLSSGSIQNVKKMILLK